VTSAAIIGAGDLGGAVAQALASRQSVDRVLIIDASESAAKGKALDIQQSGAISGFDTQLQGTGDLARAVGCQVCVVADSFRAPGSDWSADEELHGIANLARSLGVAPIVFAAASHGELMRDLATGFHVAPARLIGSSPEALASAVRAIVAMEARCAPSEVMLAVLGTPPAFVIPWSQASIGGYALEQVLQTVQLSRIEARSRKLWPPQAYALGMAAALAVDGVVRTARRALSVLTVLDGEFGVRGRIGALPARLSTTGVIDRLVPPLTTRERVLVETALGAVLR
jgi:malate dehydrogenase